MKPMPAALAATALAWLGPQVTAHEYRFTRIVDTRTPMPGSAITFSDFDCPQFDGENTVFHGWGAFFVEGQPHVREGIYTDAGGLRAVADLDTPIPGGTGTFGTFDMCPSADGGNVVFAGCAERGDGSSTCSSGTPHEGIYSDVGGLHVVADTQTPVPGASGNFRFFRPGFSADKGHVAFTASGPGTEEGIYTDVGGLRVVADGSTPIPGGTGHFVSVGSPSLRDGSVVFKGSGPGVNVNGIYSDLGGLHAVVDSSTPVPGGEGRFVIMNAPTFDGKNVAFWACTGTGPYCGFSTFVEGIYSDIGGLRAIADTSTPIPGGTGTFRAFGAPSLDRGKVVFTGRGPVVNPFPPPLWPPDGVYTDIRGFLEKVVAPGDVLDGGEVKAVYSSRRSLRGASMAVWVAFADRFAVYRADVTVPLLDLQGSPSPVAAGAPFTLRWSLRNPGPDFRGLLVAGLVTPAAALPLGLAYFPVAAGTDWADVPLASFPYPAIPQAAWVLALFDLATGELASIGAAVVTTEGASSPAVRSDLERQAAAFVRSLPLAAR
jgi:hypothetical protein